MNPSEHGDPTHGAMLEKEQNLVQDIKEEAADLAVCETYEGSPDAGEAVKRTSAETGSDTDQSSSGKRVRVSSGEAGQQPVEEQQRGGGGPRRSRASYRKPLFSISHRITEKRVATPSLEPQQAGGGGQRLNFGDILLAAGGGTERSPFEALAAAAETMTTADRTSSAPDSGSGLYPLIEKMFFILNTLNSSMTQLHSKVDLLSLEVTRIKKQIKPSEMATEFQPPPEYLLTGDELGQLVEQTSSAGELGCRLLVHLFPELFKAKECSSHRGCAADKSALDSLHLQLIRNYVEVCFPSVKSNAVWQEECLLQINDFFNRFWAQRDMESARLHHGGKQTTESGVADVVGIKVEQMQTQTCRFINEEGREEEEEEPASPDDDDGRRDDDSAATAPSDLLAFDPRLTEDLDEFSSPEAFVVCLVHRLFPEVFEEATTLLPEGGGLNGVGQLILDSDRIEIIRKYMEANFPDVPEDTWLQVCVQRMEDALEGPRSDGSDEADDDAAIDDDYDPASGLLPDDVSIVKVTDLCDYERPGRRSNKKSLLTPVDFEDLEVPPPDFTVPRDYLLSKELLKSNYDCSLSIGNFASRLLVLIFPELFTPENARKHYNCSGSLGKKRLDPVRVNLIRHYVQLLYPRAENDRVWMLEFVGKLDERCRRRDTEQRRSYQQQRKIYGPLDSEQGDPGGDFLTMCHQAAANPLHPDGGGGPTMTTTRESDPDVHSLLPPEKSSKDFCKIPLEDLTVCPPDFAVPPVYLLSDAEVREIVQQSLSVGNFAARLLVRLFPELFTQENLRLQYNHSGACNKKQLCPLRLRLIRHYVEAVYPVDKMEEVWHYECVPSVDERCRRPNRKKCDILKKAKRSSSTVS